MVAWWKRVVDEAAKFGEDLLLVEVEFVDLGIVNLFVEKKSVTKGGVVIIKAGFDKVGSRRSCWRGS